MSAWRSTRNGNVNKYTLTQHKGWTPPTVTWQGGQPRGGSAWKGGPARQWRRCRLDSTRPSRLRRARPINPLLQQHMHQNGTWLHLFGSRVQCGWGLSLHQVKAAKHHHYNQSTHSPKQDTQLTSFTEKFQTRSRLGRRRLIIPRSSELSPN